jgi:hypothetical protein
MHPRRRQLSVATDEYLGIRLCLQVELPGGRSVAAQVRSDDGVATGVFKVEQHRWSCPLHRTAMKVAAAATKPGRVLPVGSGPVSNPTVREHRPRAAKLANYLGPAQTTGSLPSPPQDRDEFI